MFFKEDDQDIMMQEKKKSLIISFITKTILINRKINPKFCMEPQKYKKAKVILRKNKARGISLPDIKIYYKAKIIKQYGSSKKNVT